MIHLKPFSLKQLKYLPILSAFLLLSQYGYGQKTEYGLGIGGVNYAGDLVRGYHIENQNFGVQGIYRINFDKDISFKTSLMFGKISASDTQPLDALASIRNSSFNRSILELSGTFEYHFLDYKSKHSTIRWSPYFFAGLGVTKIMNLDKNQENINSLHPVLPFGGGFKYLVGKQFSASIEFGARKMWTDQFDQISEARNIELVGLDKGDTQYGNPNDKDWYHFFNVSFSYILFKIDCKYQYVPNRGLYK